MDRSNGNIAQTCEHEWINIRIPGNDGIYVAFLKFEFVDIEETR